MATFSVDKNKIAKNTIALYIRMGITMAIAFFTTRITLEVLGVENYGLNNLVGSIVAMFSFINGSIGTAIQRFYSISIGKKDNDEMRRVFGVGLYLHRGVALISLVGAEIFAVFFLSDLNIPSERIFAAHVVFQISVLSLVLNILNVPYSALLRAREDFSQIALLEIIQSVLRLGVLYLLCVIEYDKLITLSMLNLGVTIFFVTSIFFYARKYEETHTSALFDRKLIREMLVFVSMLIFTVLSMICRDQGVVVLINVFFGLTVNAAYGIAMQIMSVINTFVMNFKQAVVPQMMAAYGANDIPTMTRLVNLGTKVTFVLLLIICLPIYYETDFILNLWLKNPPEGTAELVKLVVININVASFTYFLYQAVHATGKINRQQTVLSILYFLNIALIFAAFKLGMNYESALYITILVSFGQCVVNLYYAWRNFGYDPGYFLKNILARSLLLIAIVLAVFQVVILIENEWIKFISTIFASVLVPILAGCVVLLEKEEVAFIRNMFIKAGKRQ